MMASVTIMINGLWLWGRDVWPLISDEGSETIYKPIMPVKPHGMFSRIRIRKVILKWFRSDLATQIMFESKAQVGSKAEHTR
jgi:hypothetical protein